MPQITSVEPQKKKKDRFNIFLDGIYAFSLDTGALVKNNVKKGKKLSQKEIELLLKESETSKLVDLALNFLTYRPRSQKEVEDYVAKKISIRENMKFTQAKESGLITNVVNKLKKYKYIDDVQFAKWFVASRNKSRPKGKRLLQLELIKKGISRDTVNSILAKAPDQKALAQKAIEKKIKSWKNLTESDFKNKAYRYLASRGFDWDEISAVVAQLLKKR